MNNRTHKSKQLKRLFIPIFGIFLSLNVHAQKHEVKLSLVDLAHGEAKLYYEYHINDSWSAEIGLGHQRERVHLFGLDDNLLLSRPKNFTNHTLGFDLIMKYYFKKNILNTGAYIGPRFSYYRNQWKHPNLEKLNPFVRTASGEIVERYLQYGGVLGMKIPIVNRLLVELEANLLFSPDTYEQVGGQAKVIYRIGKK